MRVIEAYLAVERTQLDSRWVVVVSWNVELLLGFQAIVLVLAKLSFDKIGNAWEVLLVFACIAAESLLSLFDLLELLFVDAR